MNIARCKNNHFFDGDRYNECPFCENDEKLGVSSASDKKIRREELRFRLVLPEYTNQIRIYGCVLHHPRRSAWITPNSYPVDEIRIVHNGFMVEKNKFETEQGDIIIILSNSKYADTSSSKEVVVNVQWNIKSEYHLPIFDATEAWEFVLSKEPIDAEAYMVGYVQTSENIFKCENDLKENEKRNRQFLWTQK